MSAVSAEAPVLEVSGLVKHFGVTRGLINRKTIGLDHFTIGVNRAALHMGCFAIHMDHRAIHMDRATIRPD